MTEAAPIRIEHLDTVTVVTSRVEDGGDDLASTGFGGAPMLLYGGGSLAAGLLLLALGRRRRV